MGVKSQCVKLEKLGYLATARKHRARGRPEVTYRLTPKGRELFPQGGVELAMSFLDHISRLAGSPFPEKVLFAHFQARGEEYAAALESRELPARVSELARLRAAEGCFSRLEHEGLLRLVESHSPLQRLFQKYPEAKKFETAAISKALGVPVYREEGPAGEIVFFIASSPAHSGANQAASARSAPKDKEGGEVAVEDSADSSGSELPVGSGAPEHSVKSSAAKSVARKHAPAPEQAELFVLGGD